MIEMLYLGWSYAFVMALLPFTVGVHVEFGRAINKPPFFCAGAAITGAVLVLPKVYFLEGASSINLTPLFSSAAGTPCRDSRYPG
jgi:hypothetical protein